MNCSPGKIISLFLSVILASSIALSATATDNGHFVRFVSANSEIITPGKNFAIDLYFEVKKGCHIQSNKIGAMPTIPTALTIQPPASFEVGQPKYPADKTFHLEGSPEALKVFDGLLHIRIQARALPSTETGKHFLRGVLYYQVCDDRRCFYPRTLEFEFEVEL